MRGARASDLLLAISGFVVWSAAFSAIYGAFSLGCWLGWDRLPFGPTSIQKITTATVWLAFIVLGSLVVWLARRRARQGLEPVAPFLGVLLPSTNLAALAATIVTGLPILLASSCS
ncbi:hypothetical protein [Terrihabitans sp. B22-R8]|uniref:hypothetical protein n=1 Tax=Terrihabitans sp. B22-R8 TaxID=3425128 RepID=UPI00403CE658